MLGSASGGQTPAESQNQTQDTEANESILLKPMCG